MEQQRIRKGNDIPIQWEIFDSDNHPYSLAGKDLLLTLSSALGGPVPVSRPVVEGNRLSFTYFGKDQKTLGSYTVTLEENRGKEGMVTVDEVNAFILVAHSCQAGGESPSPNLTISPVVLRSQLSLVAVSQGAVPVDDHLDNDSVNPVQNKVVKEALDGKEDSIEDLDQIRSGAAAGATAVQPQAIAAFITRTVSDLANYYLKEEVYTKNEVAALIGAIQQFHYEIYASTSEVTLPARNILYLIGPTGTGSDKYEEFVYDATKINPWVKIGDASIDLSGYVTIEALNTTLANYATTARLTELLAAKQDVIADLDEIRRGAAAGATAYQKPASGIPASDLARGVIPTQNVFLAIYGTTNYSDIEGAKSDGYVIICVYGAVYCLNSVDGTYAKFFNVSPDGTTLKILTCEDGVGWSNATIYLQADWNEADSEKAGFIKNKPTIPTISTNVDTDKARDTMTSSPKSVYDFVRPAAQSSQPVGGMLPNIFYNLGTLSGNTAIKMANPADASVYNEYMFQFRTGATAPTITWDSKITAWLGGSAPTINASKTYQVSVVNGLAVIGEF